MPDVPTTDQILEIDDPRLRLLHAGARLLTDDPFAALTTGISPDAVTSTAGRSRRVFYDHFATKAEFAEALLTLYLDVDLVETVGAELDATMSDLSEDARGGDIHAAIREMTAELFAPSTVTVDSVIDMIVRSVGVTNPTVHARLADYDEHVDARYRRVLEQGLGTWHQQLRPPWTVEELALTLRALADGLSMRNATRPGTVGAELFAMQVAALVTAATQPEDTVERPFGEELRRVSRLTQVRRREEEDPSTHIHSRQRVLQSVAPSLRDNPGTLPSFEDLADRAGVSVRRIQNTFGSTLTVLSETILDSLPPLAREARFDLETDAFAVDVVLRRHLLRLARWADAHPELAIAASTFRNHPDGGATTSGTLLGAVDEVTGEILDTASARGEIRGDTETADVASLITHAVLIRCAAGAPPEQAAEWLVTTVLDGVRQS